MLYAVLGFASLVLLVYCVIDIIRTPAEAARNLPKLLWLGLVVLLPLPGGLAWLFAGRPSAGAPPVAGSGRVRPAVRPAPAAPPDDDEEFLRSIARRAEEQRRKAAEAAEAAQRDEAAERERRERGEGH